MEWEFLQVCLGEVLQIIKDSDIGTLSFLLTKSITLSAGDFILKPAAANKIHYTMIFSFISNWILLWSSCGVVSFCYVKKAEKSLSNSCYWLLLNINIWSASCFPVFPLSQKLQLQQSCVKKARVPHVWGFFCLLPPIVQESALQMDTCQ